MQNKCTACNQYKTPSLAVDGILFQQGKILLIKRKHEPFKNRYALPGGFIEYGETAEKAVIREVWEETHLKTGVSQLIGVYSQPKRDPRRHTISLAYALHIKSGTLKAGSDANLVKWFEIDKLPKLAFDHEQIIADFRNKNKITTTYNGWDLSKKLIFCSHTRHIMHASLLINKFVIEQGCVPINSFTNFGYFLYELAPRHDITESINNIINRCDEQWVFGPITEGVRLEIEMCRTIGKPVRFFDITEDEIPCLITEVDEKTLAKRKL